MRKLTRNKLDTYDKKICFDVATPINLKIDCVKEEDDTTSIIATLTWLCKTMDNELMCLHTSYLAEDSKNEEFLIQFPITSSDNVYCNYEFTSNILMTTLEDIESNLDFRICNNNNDNPIYCFGKGDSETKYKIELSYNAFASLAYVNNYILGTVYDNANLYTSLKTGVQASLVSNIDESFNLKIPDNNIEIKDLGLVNYKHSKTKDIIVSAEISSLYFHNLKVMLLIPIDKKRKILNKHIKNNTLNNMMENFLLDKDQFIYRYSFTNEIYIDEYSYNQEYIFVYATNPNDDGILIAIAENIYQDLISSIDVALNKIAD